MQETANSEQPTVNYQRPKFGDLPIGSFFICRNGGAFAGWTKADETSARRTTPLGHVYGEPVAFEPDVEPWVTR